jgi:hypothetical protein
MKIGMHRNHARKPIVHSNLHNWDEKSQKTRCREPRAPTIHIPIVATLTATSAVTDNSVFVWATASVMTPVIIPGLAANNISGVMDGFRLRP